MIEELLAFAPGVAVQLALVGVASGVILGAASKLSDFCTLGALETAIFGGDTRRLRVWAIALGVAILGTTLGARAGLIDLHRSIYYSVAWNPMASVAGGLLFGYGMAMAGNCGFGAAVRAGGGDIRSVVIVVVLGISAHATLSGPLGPIRAAIFPQWAQIGPSGIPHTLERLTGLPVEFVAVPISFALVWWALRHPGMVTSRVAVLAAGAIGLAVVLSFAGTTLIADNGMEAIHVEGPSFTAPVGRTILYLMTSTGTAPSYAVGSVLGVILGACLVANLRGEFRWEACEDPRELGRQMGGASLMGVGGAVAMGCTIGQGLTGIAALAWSGPTTLVAICLGAYAGLRQLLGETQVEG